MSRDKGGDGVQVVGGSNPPARPTRTPAHNPSLRRIDVARWVSFCRLPGPFSAEIGTRLHLLIPARQRRFHLFHSLFEYFDRPGCFCTSLSSIGARNWYMIASGSPFLSRVTISG